MGGNKSKAVKGTNNSVPVRAGLHIIQCRSPESWCLKFYLVLPQNIMKLCLVVAPQHIVPARYLEELMYLILPVVVGHQFWVLLCFLLTLI